MCKKIIFFFSLFVFTLPAKSQVKDSVVAEILVQCEQKNWDKVLDLFKVFAQEDPYNAEVFYWLRAADNESIKAKVLPILAKSYLKNDNPAKAIELYKELVLKTTQPVSSLLEIAETVIAIGDVRVSQLIYEKIIERDSTNLKANLFLGNFIYLRGEKERLRIEYTYSKKKKHTRMEYAEYRSELKNLLDIYYLKSREHLVRANKLRHSAEIVNTIKKIDDLEELLK